MKKKDMNRKGLSEVVTNVLIILLVVIAIGVLWAFIGPMISKTGEKVEVGTTCITMASALAPVSCAKTASDVNVSVKRSAGQANLKALKLIFEKEGGETAVITKEGISLAELETKVYSSTINEIKFSPKAVSVAAGIEDSAGKVSYCEPSQIKVACA
jgi:FlaG/FlaF family flagellin (archaellin)